MMPLDYHIYCFFWLLQTPAPSSQNHISQASLIAVTVIGRHTSFPFPTFIFIEGGEKGRLSNAA